MEALPVTRRTTKPASPAETRTRPHLVGVSVISLAVGVFAGKPMDLPPSEKGPHAVVATPSGSNGHGVSCALRRVGPVPYARVRFVKS